MRFKVTRTSVNDYTSPCEEAAAIRVTRLDYRTVKTLEEAREPKNKRNWSDEWFKTGTNHREDKEKEMVVRDITETAWIVDFTSLEKLIDFQKKYGDLILRSPEGYYIPQLPIIEIFDDYIS